MSALPVEAVEPDPAATSLPNDETVNKENGSAPEPATETAPAADAETEKMDENGAVASTEDASVDKDTEMAGGERKPRREKKLRTYENGVLKTSAQAIEGQNNSKYDPSVLPESSDASKIRAQVEFYFGDSNMPDDAHMQDLTGGEENRPVPIGEIMKFGRMKRFLPVENVIAALKESNFLKVTNDEGKECISRVIAWDPESNKTSKVEARTVYVKGFGDEEPSSQFDIEAFFAPYGPTRCVRLRRTAAPEKLFKGSVFVEFQDEETQQSFLDLDPKPLWKGKHILEVQAKKDYMKKKDQEIRDGKIEPQEARTPYQHSRGGGRGRGRGRGRGGNFKGGDRDPDDWKKRREDDRASGYRDDRKNGRGRDRDHKKGGRGGRRDDRGPRNNDRHQEREDKDREVKSETVEKSEAKAEVKNEEPSENKRSREDEGADEQPAKKVKAE